MQQPQHHHHKPKPSLYGSSSWIRRSPPPSPHKKPWGAGGRSRYACRLVPLLVLTLYSLFTVLRIPSSSLVVNTADSERVERRDDVDAFKTHRPSLAKTSEMGRGASVWDGEERRERGGREGLGGTDRWVPPVSLTELSMGLGYKTNVRGFSANETHIEADSGSTQRHVVKYISTAPAVTMSDAPTRVR